MAGADLGVAADEAELEERLDRIGDRDVAWDGEGAEQFGGVAGGHRWCALRHSAGVAPAMRRNLFEKCAWSAKPAETAISLSGASVSAMSFMARSILIRTM